MKTLNSLFSIRLIAIFQFICGPSFGQIKIPRANDFVKFEAIVKFVDSEFVLIPKLTVLQFFYYYKNKLTFIDTKWAVFEVLAEPVKEFGNVKGLDE